MFIEDEAKRFRKNSRFIEGIGEGREGGERRPERCMKLDIEGMGRGRGKERGGGGNVGGGIWNCG